MLKYENKRLLFWCLLMTWLLIAAEILFMGYVLIELWILYTLQIDESELSDAAIDFFNSFSDSFYRIADPALDATALIVIVAFIVNAIWIYRSSYNARQQQDYAERMSPWWTLVSFVVPIVNLFAPYRGIKEIWLTAKDPGGWREPTPRFFAFWWGAWIITNILSNISNAMTSRAEEPRDFIVADWMYLASGPLMIISAILFMRIMREVTARQSQYNAQLHQPAEP